MERWKQYSGLAAVFAVAVAAGLWGFRATGGSLPWAKRSARALQRGIEEGGGSLIDIGRGIIIAGPIRKGGMVLEFAALVVLLVAVGIGLYIYAERYQAAEDETA
ncbi:cobalamin transport operon protein [Haladaptatus sp. F3-133]|jgi:hypothetical protein|uniref:Cobalamin transport operon protein n=1 Tax=Halorutilus salinus TaxID=2487751 RepID=A0A9Q4C5P0_9EURY|nr:cobalamin transport operon protein [Halorutilus salinus]MCX2818746.1 cobalamin transport operon protein [Halorutilus salinus]